MDNFLIDELNFCKFQISSYTSLYEKLLSKYLDTDLTRGCKPVAEKKHRRKEKFQFDLGKFCNKLAEDSVDENDNIHESDSVHGSSDNKEKDPADQSDDLTMSIMNFICKSTDTSGGPTRREESGKSNEENGKSVDVVRDPNSYENAVTNRKLIRDSAKNEDIDIKSIDDRKQAARANLHTHTSKLAYIHSEEQRLLALGMDPQLVHKRIREKYYPEAIPAKERNAPSIMVEARDGSGRLQRKKVNLLAFDDKSDSDGDCPDSPNLDLPVFSEEEIDIADEDVEDAEEDIVDEKPIE